MVFAGFVVGVLCSLIGSQIMLQGDGYTYPAVALRVAVGSGIAFLTAQLLDVAVFDALRRRAWWLPPLASTLVGSAVDTALFFTIAFSASITLFGPEADAAINWAWEAVPFLGVGAEVPLWVSLAVRRLAGQTFARFGGTCAVSTACHKTFTKCGVNFVDPTPNLWHASSIANSEKGGVHVERCNGARCRDKVDARPSGQPPARIAG